MIYLCDILWYIKTRTRKDVVLIYHLNITVTCYENLDLGMHCINILNYYFHTIHQSIHFYKSTWNPILMKSQVSKFLHFDKDWFYICHIFFFALKIFYLSPWLTWLTYISFLFILPSQTSHSLWQKGKFSLPNKFPSKQKTRSIWEHQVLP